MGLLCNELEELTWKDVQAEVKRVNPELAGIIDKINPGNKFKLIRASYQFGDYILKHGELFLPHGRSLVSLKQAEPKIQSQLNYSTIPLFLTLKNCNEVFIDTGSRIIPLNLFYPGSLLGLFETMDFLLGRTSAPKWSVSAGARSIFMLQKINRADGFKRLRFAYGLSSHTTIQDIGDHWNVFRQIAQHQNFTQSWQQQVLFFTKDWFVHNKDPAWFDFHRYLYKQGWEQAQFSIGKISPSLSWESFIEAINFRGLKLTPYLADQIKHIMLIADGKWLGFRPVENAEIAPIFNFKKAFLETYQLQQEPIFMHPAFLSQESKRPVYYSLAFPTLLEGSPHNNNSATIMLNLRDIKNYMKILSENLKTVNYLNNFLENISFNYFHVESDKHQEINPSISIPDGDKFFLNLGKESFCYTSPFWRGCISIGYKDSL